MGFKTDEKSDWAEKSWPSFEAMKTILSQLFFPCSVVGLLLLSSCGGTAEKRVVVLDRPDPTELTQTKHVKPRNGRQNKRRVEYYNSLQYKNAYKQQY